MVYQQPSTRVTQCLSENIRDPRNPLAAAAAGVGLPVLLVLASLRGPRSQVPMLFAQKKKKQQKSGSSQKITIRGAAAAAAAAVL